MNSYLIFDARCSACSSLARTIEEVATGKLKVITIGSEQAKELLSQDFPDGWEYRLCCKNKCRSGKSIN